MSTAHEHHVPASIDPELKEHTKLFERKIHKIGDKNNILPDLWADPFVN